MAQVPMNGVALAAAGGLSITMTAALDAGVGVGV
jgi:hypothetical protein